MKRKNKNKAPDEHVINSQKSFSLFFLIYTVLSAFSICYLCAYARMIMISGVFQLWLSLAYGYWVAISFIMAQIGIGQLIMRLPILRDSDLKGIPFLIFSFGIGFYITNCILTLFGIFKWINGFAIYIYVLLSLPLIFIGCWAIRDHFFFYGENNNAEDTIIKKKWVIWLASFLFLIWVFPYFIQTLLPNTDWDGAWQHLPLPKLFLERGISWVTPGFMQYNFPGAVHLVYSLFLFIKAETAIVPFNFIISFGILVTAYCFSNHFFGKQTALWAIAIAAAINIMWEVSLTPRIDSFLAFFCFLSVYAFFIWIQDNEKNGRLIIAGMMLGMAAGIKYTAILFFPALLFIIVIHMFQSLKIKSAIKIVPLSLAIVCILIPSGCWYARNAIQLGDPVYPLISGDIFYDAHGNKLKFYPALYDHLKNMPPRENVENVLNNTGLHLFTNYEDTYHATKKQKIFKFSKITLFNIWDILTNPDAYSRKPYHEITPLLILFIALPFFDRRKLSLFLYFIGCFFFLIIAAKSHLLRYALPVFPLFAVGAANVLSNIRVKPVIFLMAILSAFFLFRFSFLESKKLVRMEPLSYLSGNLERIEWLTGIGYNWDKTTPPLIKFINKQIANGSMDRQDVIFMIGEGKGNLLECNYLPDSSRSAVPWLEELIKSDNNYLKIKNSLKEKGINYFAINYYYLYWAFDNSRYDKKPLVFGIYHLQRFLEKHTEIIYNNNGMVLAKIK